MVHFKRFGLEVSPGTVYYQIGKLVKEGIIKGVSIKGKNIDKTIYELTDKGMKVFKEFKDKWREPIRYAYHNIVD